MHIGVNGAVFNVSASNARGPWFKPRRLHSSFSLKSSDFVPVSPQGLFPGVGQARIETNLFIYLFIVVKKASTMFLNKVPQTLAVDFIRFCAHAVARIEKKYRQGGLGPS